MLPQANEVYLDVPHWQNPPHIPSELCNDATRRCAARRPFSAAFGRSNLHLTPESLAQRDLAAQSEPSVLTGLGQGPNGVRRAKVTKNSGPLVSPAGRWVRDAEIGHKPSLVS